MQLGYDSDVPQTKSLTGLVISNIDYVAQHRAFPQARLDDGHLHVMERGASRFRRVWNNISMLAGLHPTGADRMCRSLRVKMDTPAPLMADGEILEAVREFSVDCVAGAITCNRAAGV